ncbi:type II toxin-antitoxin system death-on-curing family toxin [Candidatus Saccharibacteria bacterium]|nr:type II toxin-antitoxin system death-on-curing family toxin [Candidatus Saccharibacteria bacterium]
MSRQLTIQEAEYIAHALALELMNYVDEPIPPFDTRSPGILESCLAEPFQTFGGEDLHLDFNKKAAALFYLVTKNHPFQNGNKRMAVTLTLVFCYLNNRWLNIGARKLYELACDVATSSPRDKGEMIFKIQEEFKKNMTPPSVFRKIISRAKQTK